MLFVYQCLVFSPDAHRRAYRCGGFREALATVLGASTQGATAVLVGTSAGGVAAFNVASWLLDTFDQVGHHTTAALVWCSRIRLRAR